MDRRGLEGAGISEQQLSGIDLATLQTMRDDLERRMPGYEELGITLLLDDYRKQLQAIELEIRSRLVCFMVDGDRVSLRDLLAANADDTDLCDWARGASPGDDFPAFVGCVCVPSDLENARRASAGRPYLPGTRPEYTRDAAFAAIVRGTL